MRPMSEVGTLETSRDVRNSVAFGGKADVAKAPSLLLLNSIQIIDNGEHAGSRDGI